MTRRSFPPLVLLVTLGLAACGGGSVPVAGAPAPAPAPAAAPAAAPSPAPVVAAAPPAMAVPDSLQPGRFDTGKMWTFENPPLEYFQQEYGFTPSADWLTHVRLSALRLPNCSASFVSATGLVLTNHHCAREAATAVSRGEEDLGDTGFFAARQADERRVPDLYVDQLVEIRDVTGEVQAAIPPGAPDEAQVEAREEKIDEIEERVSGETGLECGATSLYHGGRYSLYCYRRYDDVRLVFAPETQIGYFGGDPDNFTYPRYSLDVSFFRVYDADGAPLKPRNFLTWSSGGPRAGEVVFVVGNPGSTSRLETVAQLEYKRDTQYPFLLRLIGSRAEILDQFMTEHPEQRAAIINDYFSLTNALKAYTGELKGLRTPELMARKLAFERNFRNAVARNPELASRFGTLWTEIADLRRQVARVAPTLNALTQGGLLRSKTLEIAIGLLQYGPAAASGRVPEEQLAEFKSELAKARVNVELDIRILAAQLEDARTLLGPNDAWVVAALGGRTPLEASRATISGSALTDPTGLAAFLDQPETIGTSTDPALRLMRSALPRLQQAGQQIQQLTAQEEVRAGKLARALFDVYGTDIAPDATFTLRLADGVVKGYNYNGTEAPWFTTFHGVFDRFHSFTGREEWSLPQKWKAPPAAFDLKTPLNFVSTNDIIGGNSGSPVVDRDGRVVGLIFDGNIESLPGDFIYTTETARAVSVHSEGILEALRDLYGARRIVEELTSTRR